MTEKTIHTALILLGTVALLCIAGGIYLAGVGKEVPEFLVAVGGTAVGGLAGLLAPPRTSAG